MDPSLVIIGTGAAMLALLGFTPTVIELLEGMEQRRLGRLAQRPRTAKQGTTGATFWGLARQSGSVLSAPLSNRPCLAWHVTVTLPPSQRHRGGLDEKNIVETFTLATKDGDIEVRAKGSLLSLDVDHRQTQSLTQDLSPHALAWLQEQGFDPTNWIGMNLPLVLTEGIVELNERIRMTGSLKSEKDPTKQVGYRQNATRLVFDGRALTISDKVPSPSESPKPPSGMRLGRRGLLAPIAQETEKSGNGDDA